MNDESIICRYVFTGKQHGRAMGCYWRHARIKWFILFCMLLGLFQAVYGEMHPGNSGAIRTITAGSVFLDFLPIVSFFGILFIGIFLLGKLAFRRTAFFNEELVYTLNESGIHVRSTLMNSDVDWAIYYRATESSNGFAVFQKGGRTFLWLPKDGFDSEGSIKRCRKLLQEKIKKTNLLAA